MSKFEKSSRRILFTFFTLHIIYDSSPFPIHFNLFVRNKRIDRAIGPRHTHHDRYITPHYLIYLIVLLLFKTITIKWLNIKSTTRFFFGLFFLSQQKRLLTLNRSSPRYFNKIIIRYLLTSTLTFVLKNVLQLKWSVR